MVISGSGCRFQVVSGVAVVTAPAEIDIASASHLRTALLQAAIDGHTTVVVDMTHTQLCDSAGLNLLVRVHKRSLAKGGELRLVLHDGTAVRRIFAVTGIDRVIPYFVSLPDALVADTRACEQCGAVFVPQREHARFCSASCRADWNREHLGDPAVEASALQWSLTAMSEATGRLAGMSVQDRPRALAVAGEAVWWITMVDATLVRHHPEIWEAALVARGLAERRLIDGTLAGLRFVRNRIGREAGLEELIGFEVPANGRGCVTDWAWRPVPEPAIASLPPRGQLWEMTRYRAYRSHLVGHTIGETFGRAVAFLMPTGVNAACNPGNSIGARR
jgi:anti-sigma B factor antagonist